MTIVQINKRYYKTVTLWNELSGKQLLHVINTFERAESVIVAQIALFKIICGISWFRLWLAGTLEIEDKLYLTQFLFDKNTLTRNAIPKYKKLYGPTDEFTNMIVSEFIFAEQSYRQYKDDHQTVQAKEDHLNNLIAVIYRPGKKGYNLSVNVDGDVRQPFNDNLTLQYKNRVARWPKIIKLSILHWFEGCLFNLIDLNPDIFGGSSNEIAKYGLWSIMRGVAEKGIHGDINQVEKMYVKVFMMELTELNAEAVRLESIKPKQ